MPLSLIRDQSEALSLIDEITSDVRLTELRLWFTDREKIKSLVSQLKACYPEVDSSDCDLRDCDGETAQVNLLLDHWNSLETTSVATVSNDEIDSLVRDAKAWDFRRGKERDSIPSKSDLLPESLRELVFSISSDWGMCDSSSPRGLFDLVIPIGGLVPANIGRPASVAGWIREGLKTSAVLALASARETSKKEKELAVSLGVPSDTEQDSLRYGLELAFRLDPWDWREVGEGLSIQQSQNLKIELAIAPPGSSGRRATTEEGLRWALGQVGLLENSDVLLVTTSIYWIANQVSARVALPRTTRVTTCGYDLDLAPGPIRVFTAQHYLQEIKSAIDALPKLKNWAVGA